MTAFTRWCVRAGGRRAHRRFVSTLADAEAVQARLLRGFVRGNAGTEFGAAHRFADIDGPDAYAAAVPVREYEGFRPWIDRIVAGEPGVLTAEPPHLLARTSGTTAQPKLIPVTRSWLDELKSLLRVWVFGALRDHPTIFNGRIAAFVDPPTEGATEAGVPYGSVSGLTHARGPRIVRRLHVLPPALARLSCYDDRYFVAARLALAHDVTLLVAVNPTTLIKLAQVCRAHGDRILSAIADGRIGIDSLDGDSESPVAAELRRGLRPDPLRAKQLQQAATADGELLPRHCWPDLGMIACWLGGSAGVLSSRLGAVFGDVRRRDLGFRATEATMTVPLDDETDAGVLAIGANYYEFYPADQEVGRGRPLLAHEVREGERYRIVLTTRTGLYRYDICDVIEVRGFVGTTPLIAFLHKGRDMVNITGEKLHARQIALASDRASGRVGLPIVQVQVIPDVESCRYDVLVELPTDETLPMGDWSAAFDRELASLNIEYEAKRRSGRLGECRVWQMRTGWSARRQRAHVLGGARDTQYKWRVIEPEWDGANRDEVLSGDPGAVKEEVA